MLGEGPEQACSYKANWPNRAHTSSRMGPKGASPCGGRSHFYWILLCTVGAHTKGAMQQAINNKEIRLFTPGVGLVG